MGTNLSVLGIGIAVVVNFLLGWLRYGPLFGKAWAIEMGMDINQKPDPSVMIKGILCANSFGSYSLGA